MRETGDKRLNYNRLQMTQSSAPSEFWKDFPHNGMEKRAATQTIHHGHV